MPPKRKTTSKTEEKDHEAPENGTKLVALDVEETKTSNSVPTTRVAKSKAKAAAAKAEATDDAMVDTKAEKKTSTRGKAKADPVVAEPVVEVQDTNTKTKGKGKGKAKAEPAAAEPVVEVQNTDTKAKAKGKGKAKAEPVAEPAVEPQVEAKSKAKGKSKAKAEAAPEADDNAEAETETKAGAKKGKAKKADADEEKKEYTTVEPKPVDIVCPDGALVLTSWNVNGLRASLRTGFSSVYKTTPPSDIVFLQEVKGDSSNFGDASDFGAQFAKDGYKAYLNCGTIPGYAGTAVLYMENKVKPLRIVSDNSLVADVSLKKIPPYFAASGLGLTGEIAEKLATLRAQSPFAQIQSPSSNSVESKSVSDGADDADLGAEFVEALKATGPLEITQEMIDEVWKLNVEEGRVITVELQDKFLVGAYVPNSGQKLERLDFRTNVWEPAMLLYFKQLETKKPVVYTGDLNVAHLDIDCWSPGTNKRSAGFTPQERARFSTLMSAGFIDSFRHLYGNSVKAHTFWGYRHDAKVQEKGWRLDYWILSQSLKTKVKQVVVGTECPNLSKLERASDHAPLTLVLEQ